MSSRKEFLDKLVRKPVQLARHPNIRDLTVDKEGNFIDLVTNQNLADPLWLDAEHLQKKIILVNFFSLRNEVKTQKMAKISELVKQLGDKVGQDIFVNSVTNDPDHDTTKRLVAFAEQLGAPDGWTFIRAMGETQRHITSKMNRVRGYSSGREVFYGIPGGFWGTFPIDNATVVTARRLIDSIPGPKPSTLRRAGPARLGKEKYTWSARSV